MPEEIGVILGILCKVGVNDLIEKLDTRNHEGLVNIVAVLELIDSKGFLDKSIASAVVFHKNPVLLSEILIKLDRRHLINKKLIVATISHKDFLGLFYVFHELNRLDFLNGLTANAVICHQDPFWISEIFRKFNKKSFLNEEIVMTIIHHENYFSLFCALNRLKRGGFFNGEIILAVINHKEPLSVTRSIIPHTDPEVSYVAALQGKGLADSQFNSLPVFGSDKPYQKQRLALYRKCKKKKPLTCAFNEPKRRLNKDLSVHGSLLDNSVTPVLDRELASPFSKRCRLDGQSLGSPTLPSAAQLTMSLSVFGSLSPLQDAFEDTSQHDSRLVGKGYEAHRPFTALS